MGVNNLLIRFSLAVLWAQTLRIGAGTCGAKLHAALKWPIEPYRWRSASRDKKTAEDNQDLMCTLRLCSTYRACSEGANDMCSAVIQTKHLFKRLTRTYLSISPATQCTKKYKNDTPLRHYVYSAGSGS
jgi:hypothetical protein